MIYIVQKIHSLAAFLLSSDVSAAHTLNDNFSPQRTIIMVRNKITACQIISKTKKASFFLLSN